MILYDMTAIQPFATAKFHGGGKFAQIVFMRMIERKVVFSAYYDSSRFIDNELLKIAAVSNIPLFDISAVPFEQVYSESKASIVFSILPQPYMFKHKTVGTIHDIREIEEDYDKYQFRYKTDLKTKVRYTLHKLLKNYYREKRIKLLENKLNDKNFFPTTITLFTKFAIMNAVRKQEVLQMPVFMTPSFYKDSEERPDCSNKNYILILSGNRPIKNALRAIEALDTIFDIPIFCNYRVAITGVEDEKLFRYKIKNIERFEFRGYVDEKELKDLYAHCSFLLFPSLYEGFGMPLEEAMFFGKPIIASCLTAIPEVCGRAAIYVNPYSSRDIAAKAMMLMSDSAVYDFYVQESKKRFTELFQKQQDDLDGYIDYVISLDNENEK